MPFDDLLFYTTDAWFVGDGTNRVMAVLQNANLLDIGLIDELVATGHHSGLLVIGPTSSITLSAFNFGNVNLISDVGNLTVAWSHDSNIWAQNNIVTHARLLNSVRVSASFDTLASDLSMVNDRNSDSTIYHGEHTRITLRGGIDNTIVGYEMDSAIFAIQNVQNSYVNVDSGDVTYNVTLNRAASGDMNNLYLSDGTGDATIRVHGAKGSHGVYSGGAGRDCFIFDSLGNSDVSGDEGRDIFIVRAGDVNITDFNARQDILILGDGMEQHRVNNHDGTWTVTIHHTADQLFV